MREIKFRAWHTEQELMFFKGDNYGTTHDLDCVAYSRSQPVILLQYTGIKDKNGVEIYEGDLITDESGEVVTVEYGDFYHEGGLMNGFFIKVNGSTTTYPITTASTGEVIGNIYENKELLG